MYTLGLRLWAFLVVSPSFADATVHHPRNSMQHTTVSLNARIPKHPKPGLHSPCLEFRTHQPSLPQCLPAEVRESLAESLKNLGSRELRAHALESLEALPVYRCSLVYLWVLYPSCLCMRVHVFVTLNSRLIFICTIAPHANAQLLRTLTRVEYSLYN